MWGISVASGTPASLGGERRRKSEDVADDDVGAHLLQQRQQRPRRLGCVIAVGRVGVGRREHPVFLGRGEAEPGALDRRAPLLPGLDHHLVPAPASAWPSAIAGKTWPASPKAATSTRMVI